MAVPLPKLLFGADVTSVISLLGVPPSGAPMPPPPLLTTAATSVWSPPSIDIAPSPVAIAKRDLLAQEAASRDGPQLSPATSPTGRRAASTSRLTPIAADTPVQRPAAPGDAAAAAVQRPFSSSASKTSKGASKKGRSKRRECARCTRHFDASAPFQRSTTLTSTIADSVAAGSSTLGSTWVFASGAERFTVRPAAGDPAVGIVPSGSPPSPLSVLTVRGPKRSPSPDFGGGTRRTDVTGVSAFGLAHPMLDIRPSLRDTSVSAAEARCAVPAGFGSSTRESWSAFRMHYPGMWHRDPAMVTEYVCDGDVSALSQHRKSPKPVQPSTPKLPWPTTLGPGVAKYQAPGGIGHTSANNSVVKHAASIPKEARVTAFAKAASVSPGPAYDVDSRRRRVGPTTRATEFGRGDRHPWLQPKPWFSHTKNSDDEASDGDDEDDGY